MCELSIQSSALSVSVHPNPNSVAASGSKTRYVLLDLDKLSHRLPHRKFEIRDKCWLALPFLRGACEAIGDGKTGKPNRDDESS